MNILLKIRLFIGRPERCFKCGRWMWNRGQSLYLDLANNITRNVFDFKTRQETLDACINAEILIIDDFGGESYMAVNGFHTVFDCWIPILKNRIDNGKITYISSNYNLNSLSDRLEKATDKITATIIMDRIKTIGNNNKIALFFINDLIEDII